VRLAIRRPRGMKVRAVAVSLDGKRVKVRRGRKYRAVIDLRGRPGPGTVKVRIRITGTRRGKRAVTRRTRTFRTCR
jgi:hypothetical protein